MEEISKQLACPVCNGETVYESRNPSSANIRAEIKAILPGPGRLYQPKNLSYPTQFA